MKTTCSWSGCNKPRSGKHPYCDEHIKEYRRKWREQNKKAKSFMKEGCADLDARIIALEVEVVRLGRLLSKTTPPKMPSYPHHAPCTCTECRAAAKVFYSVVH